jgi:hypothetical protein
VNGKGLKITLETVLEPIYLLLFKEGTMHHPVSILFDIMPAKKQYD